MDSNQMYPNQIFDNSLLNCKNSSCAGKQACKNCTPQPQEAFNPRQFYPHTFLQPNTNEKQPQNNFKSQAHNRGNQNNFYDGQYAEQMHNNNAYHKGGGQNYANTPYPQNTQHQNTQGQGYNQSPNFFQNQGYQQNPGYNQGNQSYAQQANQNAYYNAPPNYNYNPHMQTNQYDPNYNAQQYPHQNHAPKQKGMFGGLDPQQLMGMLGSKGGSFGNLTSLLGNSNPQMSMLMGLMQNNKAKKQSQQKPVEEIIIDEDKQNKQENEKTPYKAVKDFYKENSDD